MLFIMKATKRNIHPAFQTQADAPSSILEKADAPSRIVVLFFVESFLDMDMLLINKDTQKATHAAFQT